MFVTVLGRLEGIDATSSSYKTSTFSDASPRISTTRAQVAKILYSAYDLLNA